MIVVIGHFGFPINVERKVHGILRITEDLLGISFNGPAAVIVFFVISGFCIHYPQRKSLVVHAPSYYSRRLLRIGIPLAASCLIWQLVGLSVSLSKPGLFWSIICEIVYYLAYPGLLVVRRRVNWAWLIAASYIAALAWSVLHLDEIRAANGAYPAFGWFNWLVGLPCWLLGCWLAENFTRFPKLQVSGIVVARFVIQGAAMVTLFFAIRFHSIVFSFAFMLNIFAFPACAWLGLELVYSLAKAPFALLEWAGKWSYSLYLLHPVARALYLSGAEPRTVLDRWIIIFGALVLSYCFYLVIEKPAHHLAITISNKLKAPQNDPSTSAR